MKTQYYLFAKIKTVPGLNIKVNSDSRFDCIARNLIPGKDIFKDVRTKDGRLSFYAQEPRSVIHHARTLSRYNLTTGSLNVSGVFMDNGSSSKGFGDINSNTKLKGGAANPLSRYGHNGLLLQTNLNFNVLEILVLPNSRGLIRNLLWQKHQEGYFNNLFENHRAEAESDHLFGIPWTEMFDYLNHNSSQDKIAA
jgi:hypothetical protein